jgi:beta-galactosidase
MQNKIKQLNGMKNLSITAILLIPIFFASGNLFADSNEKEGKFLLDFNWRFKLESEIAAESQETIHLLEMKSLAKAGLLNGITGLNFSDSTWRNIDLPHDWAVELDFVNDPNLESHGYHPVGHKYLENSIGWYRKKFFIPKNDEGKRLNIKFDGVFRNCEVWLNGFLVGNNTGGYMEFSFDVTDIINYGGNNALTVRVDASKYEGWWYEGAGIYRHVWLIKNAQTYIPENGTYVFCNVIDNYSWVNIQTNLICKDSDAEKYQLFHSIIDGEGNVIGKMSESVLLKKDSERKISGKIKITNPTLWSIDNPYLYKLISEVKCGDELLDYKETTFGIRTVRFDPQKGFFLNEKPLKIKGACVHQDHAGVGVALPDRLQYYRIERLKEMGCNAYRSAHHPPTPELLEACDKLGMLVMDETRLLSSTKEYLDQFERLILRDRNHPSVIIWSLGNEEMNIHNIESGKRVAQTLKTIQRKLDPSRLCTYAGNNRGNYHGVNEVVDVRGVNYYGRTYDNIRTNDIDQYHKENPTQPIWGTEEASTLCTRGQYTVNEYKAFMSDYDKKENTFYPWCTNAEEWWKYFMKREWMAGGFIWTGFDYRGEPGPYIWPAVSSNFGVMDVCGFPKNNYYYYKSWWTDEDVLHIYPHWNWPGKTGDTINVWCQTNCESVELFLNGKSLGEKSVEKYSHVEWDVVYEPGLLEARGIKNGKKIVKKIETTEAVAMLTISPDRRTINADGEDVSVVNITALDIHGREVPDADNFIVFEIEGNGKIIGVGNGNPSSHEPDKILEGKYFRRLFNGKCQVIVQANRQAGKIKLTAISDELKPCSVEIEAKKSTVRPCVNDFQEGSF